MLFHLLCHFKRAPFRLENYHEFSRFFIWGQLYRLKDTKRSALDIPVFQTFVDHRTFFR